MQCAVYPAKVWEGQLILFGSGALLTFCQSLANFINLSGPVATSCTMDLLLQFTKQIEVRFVVTGSRVKFVPAV